VYAELISTLTRRYVPIKMATVSIGDHTVH
jgi:hypothetical protein